MYFEEMLSKISEPTDVAIFLLGFSAGYILDLFYWPGGIPPGTTAAIVAMTVVGIKKGGDSFLMGSKYMTKRRRKKRLLTLRNHFSGNMEAEKVLDKVENILVANLIDYDDFDRILNEHTQKYMQKYIDDLLKEIDSKKHLSVSKRVITKQSARRGHRTL